MTPEQRLKKAIIKKAVELGGFNDDKYSLPDITRENIDELYDDLIEDDDLIKEDYLQDAMSDIRCGGIETGIESSQWSRHYESKEVAMEIDGVLIGWTYWYGGGKYSDPDSIDWIDDAYEVEMREETQIVKVFSRKENK